jgi:uncharacterized membrane protein
MLLLRRGPRTVYRHPVNAQVYNSPPIGARIADVVTTFLGSWKFIALQTVIVIIWIVGNVYLIFHFDPYPFILLNLVLSTLAALQAPVIMMSQNRQDTKDRLRGELDFAVNRRAEAEVQALSRKLNTMIDKIDDLEDAVRARVSR